MTVEIDINSEEREKMEAVSNEKRKRRSAMSRSGLIAKRYYKMRREDELEIPKHFKIKRIIPERTTR